MKTGPDEPDNRLILGGLARRSPAPPTETVPA